MSYTRHTWTEPETITAAKLNNIEDGIEEAAQSGGGGPWDAVVYIYHDNNSAHDFEVTIESGSFDSLYAMLQNNQPPVILVKIWDDLSVERATTSMVAVYWFDDGEIDFRPKIPSTHNGRSDQNPIINGCTLLWNSNNTLEFIRS